MFCLLLLVTNPVGAETVRLFDGSLSFDVPPGFRRMTVADFVTRPPYLQMSKHAQIDGYTESDRFEVTIEAVRTVRGFTSAELTQVADTLQQMIARRAGATMHRHGLVLVGSTQWYAIDFGVQAPDESLEILMRVGIRHESLFIVAVRVANRVFPQREAELQGVLESLKLD